jgi:acyl carrier protein
MELFDEIYTKSVDLILDLKDFDEDDINKDLTFEELDLDSLDFIEIQVVLKKNYGVTIQAEAFQEGEINTIGDLCKYVINLKESVAV